MELIKITNNEGFELEVCSVGLAIKSVTLPWNNSPIIGYNTIDDYKINPNYHGCIVGRITNRINKGKLNIDNNSFQLDINHGQHHLHGGNNGLHLANWELTQEENSVIGKYTSKSGESGYPGEIEITTTITLENNKVIINYQATCDTKTPLSLTQHPYFSFGNDFSNVEMNIFAQKYVETTNELIATGKLLTFENFNLDLGIDTCFVTENEQDNIQLNATILDKESKTKLNILSDYPAFQVYTSTNKLANVSAPIDNVCICVEPQFVTGFTEFENVKGFFFDEKNEYNQTIVYEFLRE
ncbi:MAG: hypothetical protein RLZZ175_1098 [Bacteroidota bacterium]|jgi:aldose 1-epimerase